MIISSIFSTILSGINSLFSFIKKNPKFFLGVLVMMLVILLFRQCGSIEELKNEIIIKEVENKNDKNRFFNNIQTLKDSVEFIEENNIYVKSLLRVQEDELSVLDIQLESAKKNIQELVDKVGDNPKIKNIYITQISSELSTSDVMTNIDMDTLGNLSIGIKDSNQVYSLETESWFKLVPNNDSLKLVLVDKFGLNKSSLLRHRLNFSLTLSQIELENGLTRVVIIPTDTDGNSIPPSILQIPFINGVEFMDIKPNILKVPTKVKSRRRFGVLIGPSYGLYNINNSFQATWGIGISVGYTIL
mgnify:CR=1 FL=1|tara:strand:+ start:4103 stop:5008 length:906 start_codon:yes stop_codon:yes gene_type:complete